MDENLTTKTSVFLANSCYTHIGIWFDLNRENFCYQIYAVLSQKLLCVEGAYTLKDGHIIIGQMLVPNFYIYGVHLVKNSHSNIMLGPGKISFNKDTGGFVIIISTKLHGSAVSLGARKIHFFVQNSFNSADIPYLDNNFSDNAVQWNNLELAIVHPVSFTRLPEKRSESIELYMTPSIGSGIVATIGINTNKENTGGIHFDIDWNNKSFSAQNTANKPQGSLSRPNHNNKFGNINSIIPEEDSFIVSGNGNSDNKSLRNFAQTLTNNLSEQRGVGNPLQAGSLGDRIQQMKAIKNNLMNNFDNNGQNDNFIVTKPNNNDINMNMQGSGNMGNNTGFPGNQGFMQSNTTMSNNQVFGNMNTTMTNQNSNNVNQIVNPLMNQTNNNNQINQIQPVMNTMNSMGGGVSNFQMPMNNNNQMQNNLQNNNPTYNNGLMNNQISSNSCTGLMQGGYITTNYNENQVPSSNMVTTNYNQGVGANNLNLFNNNNLVNTGNQLNNMIPQPNQTVNHQQIGAYNPNHHVQTYQNQQQYTGVVNPLLNNQPHILGVQSIPTAHPYNLSRATVVTQSREDFWNKMEGGKEKDNLSLKNFVTSDIISNSIKNTNDFIYNNFKHLLTATNKKGEVISRSAIKFKEERADRKQEAGTLDSYLFKDALDKLEKNNSNKIMDEEKKQLNEKILDNIIKRYLTESDLRCNVNPAFDELYQTMSCYDTIITIKNEDILAHKVVLISQSQVFKEMIQKRDNKIPNEINKILLPDHYRTNVFKDVLKWIYTGKIASNLDIHHYRDMLMIADNLRVFTLQKILIVKYILPNMTKEASIKFLKDSYAKQLSSEVKDVWNLLATFSLNCLSKNSSQLIKSNRMEFLGMELDLLFKCIEQSVFYLVEDMHLINLIKLLIEIEYATDVYDLVTKLSKSYRPAKNFNTQNLEISELIIHLDPLKPIEIAYLSDDSNEVGPKDDLTKNIELTKNKIDIIDIKKINSNNPSTNFVENIDIKKNKQPTFTFSFNINQEHINSCTIFSEAFNTNSRSWVLKVDITEQGDISIYLVERGAPIIIDTSGNITYPYQDKYALKFNSVLFEFEVKDISYEKSGIIFFSYVSGHNQIVGYENFFNIKQLGKKDYCLFNIWIKEYPLHAACLQHIADNFQVATGHKKDNSKANEKILYDLQPHDLSYILNSDYLKVDNENTVFTCVYKYSINKSSQEIDLLINSIRYKFVDFKLLCTTARDHETIKNSGQFKRCFQRELDRRLNKTTTNFDSGSEKDMLISEKKDGKVSFSYRTYKERKFYVQGGDRLKSLNISKDLASFFLENEHHSGYIKEIEKVKSYFYLVKETFRRGEAEC
jgi:hypothetical protein